MGLLAKAFRFLQAPVAAYGTGGHVPARQANWSAALPTAGPAPRPWGAPVPAVAGGAVPAEDRTAVERYRYLLRTSAPDHVEQVHAEAFARLTPAQRRQVLEGLASEVPADERTAAADDPRTLARLATRAEMRRPGTLERVFGSAGPGAGGALAGGLLAGVAAAVVGSVLLDGLVDTGLGDSGLFDIGGDDGPFSFGGFDF